MPLTHCGPVTKYGVGDLSQHLRKRAITRNNVDLSVPVGNLAGNVQNTDYDKMLHNDQFKITAISLGNNELKIKSCL